MSKFKKHLLDARLYRCSEENEVMETSICMSMANKTFVSPLIRFANSTGLALLAVSLVPVSGCSSGSSSSLKPQVGTIAFTNSNAVAQGSITTLTVSQGTYLDVALTNDSQLLGADWSVVCGSALPPGTPLPPGQTQDEACGTFTPAHTMSSPVPGYVASATGYVTFYTAPAVPPKGGIVTLYASATSDHTRFSTLTLTIGGLPVTVGFAPAPPATLGLSASTQFKAVLNNDATGAGVNWTVICGSSACGSFSPAQTGSGVMTSYTAPAVVPNGGTVKITATSVADPTKSVSATMQIVPVSVSVTPAMVSVGTAETRSLTAFVTNDSENKGIDWSVRCTNAMAMGSCGTITSHTANGAAATYTAPSLANIAVGSSVVITAISSADDTKSATSTVTTVKGSLVSGKLQAAQQPISGALLSLHAVTTSDTTLNGADISNASVVTTVVTDQDGNFAIPYGYQCPTPSTEMYLVSAGGNAGGGTNSNLALMAALGQCSQLDVLRFVVNEATTVAAIYALNRFMADAQHVGNSNASPAGIAAAFSAARDLVDVATGLPRTLTVSGTGIVPRAKVGTLSNLLNSCAKTAGSARGDGSPCDQLFRATNPGATPSAQVNNTMQALLDLARNEISYPHNRDSFEALGQLALSSSSFVPALSAEPSDWTLVVQYPGGEESGVGATLETPSGDGLLTSRTSPSVDYAGNVWIRNSGSAAMEFVGAASCAGAPTALLPIAASFISAP